MPTRRQVLERMDEVYAKMKDKVKPKANPKNIMAEPARIGFALHPDYASQIEDLEKPTQNLVPLKNTHQGHEVVVFWDATDDQHIYFGDLNNLE